jgi:cell division protein FtsB
MRIIVYSMLLLFIGIQYPLWLGKGGWLRVYEMEGQLADQQAKNQALTLRNAKLSGDVKDLKEGTRAIEERARIEHGMLKERGNTLYKFCLLNSPWLQVNPRRYTSQEIDP